MPRLRALFGGLATTGLAALTGLAFGLVAERDARAETPRTMMLELHGGTYLPAVDAAVSGGNPWKDIFGSSSMTMLSGHLDYEVWQGFGTLAVGGGLGYAWIDGHALDSAGEATSDSVGFNLVPVQLSLVYRWDWAAVEYGVPFVPYVKAGLSAAMWWATNAKNDIANARGSDGSGREGMGLTLGWHAGAGLHFLLDIFSDSMAAGFDSESGVNNSYLFVEFMHSQLDDFGSSTSLDLSDDALSFGLAFEF